MLKAFTPSVENRFTHHFSVHLSAAQPARERIERENISFLGYILEFLCNNIFMGLIAFSKAPNISRLRYLEI